MDGPGSACLPAWCKSCQRLVSAPTEHGPPRCEQCQTPVEVIPLYDPTGLRELVPEQPINCPRCSQPTLQFSFGGLWD